MAFNRVRGRALSRSLSFNVLQIEIVGVVGYRPKDTDSAAVEFYTNAPVGSFAPTTTPQSPSLSLARTGEPDGGSNSVRVARFMPHLRCSIYRPYPRA